MEALRPLVEPILPGKCFDSLLVNWDLNDTRCIQLAISKCLGYGMIVGGSLVKLPQILKIVGAKSAAGLSLGSVLFDLTAVTATTAYNYDQQYPFSAYGEGVFLMLETALILQLALHYAGKTPLSLAFLASYAVICAGLYCHYVPSPILWWGQLFAAPIAIIGKLWQALDNYKAGHTGHLSLITVSLLFLGCIARVFTSITETGDKVIIMSFALTTVANFVLVFQVLWYWQITNKFLSTSKTAKKTQ